MPKSRKSIGMKRFFRQMLADAGGTSSVEYGIICAMIVIGLIGAVAGVGEETASMWDNVSSKSEEAIEKSR
jgi:pilus assembly protein Flp/PilA